MNVFRETYALFLAAKDAVEANHHLLLTWKEGTGVILTNKTTGEVLASQEHDGSEKAFIVFFTIRQFFSRQEEGRFTAEVIRIRRVIESVTW
jgi:hypothetical protein